MCPPAGREPAPHREQRPQRHPRGGASSHSPTPREVLRAMSNASVNRTVVDGRYRVSVARIATPARSTAGADEETAGVRPSREHRTPHHHPHASDRFRASRTPSVRRPERTKRERLRRPLAEYCIRIKSQRDGSAAANDGIARRREAAQGRARSRIHGQAKRRTDDVHQASTIAHTRGEPCDTHRPLIRAISRRSLL